MAALTWYATSSLADVHQQMSETDPGTEVTASPVTGWIAGNATGNHSPLNSQVEQALATFTATTDPDGTIDTTTGDCFRSANTYTGSFASANWEVRFAARATTATGCSGRIRCRLLRSANANGSSATEITSGQQTAGTSISSLQTGTTQTTVATFNPGAFSVTNEYIFIQLAWERTGAGGHNNSDVNMRVGNASGAGTRVVSANFVQDTNISPARVDSTLSTAAPSVVYAQTISPARVDLLLSTVAPSAVLATLLSPARADLVLSPSTPSVDVDYFQTPDAAQFVFSGTAPVVVLGGAGSRAVVSWIRVRAPAAAAISIQPAAGQLTLSTVAGPIVPATANLTLSTVAPSADIKVNQTPDAAQLTLTSVAPSVIVAITFQPVAAQLSLSTFAPSVDIKVNQTPASSQLTLTSVAPSVTATLSVSPDAGQLTLSTIAPTLVTYAPAAADLTLTTFAPTIRIAVRRTGTILGPQYPNPVRYNQQASVRFNKPLGSRSNVQAGLRSNTQAGSRRNTQSGRRPRVG
jgi:hypothetical protein